MTVRALATLLILAGGTALSGCGEKEADASTEAAEAAPMGENVVDVATRIADEDVAAAVKKAEPKPAPVIDAVVEFRTQESSLKLAREDLVMIAPAHDAGTDVWSVFVQMDDEAAEAFFNLTSSTEGAAISVVIDERIVSAPKIETPIYGGGFVFSVDDEKTANSVSTVLRGEEPPEPVIVDAEEPAEPEQVDAKAETGTEQPVEN